MKKKGTGAGMIRRVFLFCLVTLSFAYSPAYGDWSSVSPPEVSSDWELFDVHVISPTEVWFVGEDYANNRGVLLHLLKGVWTSVTTLPTVSTDWGLRGAHFISTAATPPVIEGWVVGKDTLNKKGVLLHLLDGVWTSVTLPTVSTDWELRGVHFTSSNEGWAAGRDFINKRGVLLHFKDGSWTSIAPPEGGDDEDWDLTAVHFTSASSGFAIGKDLVAKKGILLRFSTATGTGTWTFRTPPVVSDDWGLSTAHFSSGGEGWAAGQDLIDNNKAVILHFSGGGWSKVTSLPDVSSDWSIEGIHSLSVNEGWAVGKDLFNKKGVILEFSGDDWKSHDSSSGGSSLPEVSSDWGLAALHFKTSDNGWAVGRDTSNAPNRKGVLLKFGHSRISVSPTSIDFHEVGTGGPFLRKTVTVKNSGNADLKIDSITSPALPFSIETDDCSGKSVAPASSCKIIYRFDPDSAGSFEETSEIHSNDSGNDTITVTLSGNGVPGDPVSIELTAPDDGDEFTACSLYDPPTFQWEPSETFRSIELQFSPEEQFLIPVKAKGTKGVNELLAKSTLWKKIFMLHEDESTTVFWKILGIRDDNSFVESIDFSMEIGAAEPVLNPGFSPVSKTALPVISWGNNCAVKFKAWFGNDPDFTKKKSLSFSVKNPNDDGGTFSEPLTEGEWKAIRKLVGDAAGARVYWFVESWDGLKRHIQTDVMFFELTD
jgi:hypothetical protein